MVGTILVNPKRTCHAPLLVMTLKVIEKSPVFGSVFVKANNANISSPCSPSSRQIDPSSCTLCTCVLTLPLLLALAVLSPVGAPPRMTRSNSIPTQDASMELYGASPLGSTLSLAERPRSMGMVRSGSFRDKDSDESKFLGNGKDGLQLISVVKPCWLISTLWPVSFQFTGRSCPWRPTPRPATPR